MIILFHKVHQSVKIKLESCQIFLEAALKVENIMRFDESGIFQSNKIY